MIFACYGRLRNHVVILISLVEKPLIPPETTVNQKERTIQKIDSEDQLQSQTSAYSISFESDFYYYFGPFPLWTTDLT